MCASGNYCKKCYRSSTLRRWKFQQCTGLCIDVNPVFYLNIPLFTFHFGNILLHCALLNMPTVSVSVSHYLYICPGVFQGNELTQWSWLDPEQPNRKSAYCHVRGTYDISHCSIIFINGLVPHWHHGHLDYRNRFLKKKKKEKIYTFDYFSLSSFWG
jgi:hypothetical protein